MKLAAYLDDLDPTLAANLERALEAVREEFEEKITSTVHEAVSAAAAQAAEAERISAADTASPPATTTLSLDAADELRLAALDVDTAASQSEILEALLRGALRFSSRVAIFVNRGQEVQGWSASGFGSADAAIKEISLSTELAFPIGVRLSEGAAALSAENCTVICDALGAARPSMGLLLPFMLGSQVVGTIYCDRIEDEEFSVSALQLLTYIAGQTLETLPVRKRESTATLSLARASAKGSARGFEATASAAAVPAPSEEEMDEAAPEELEAEPEAEPEPELEPEPEPEPVVSDFQVVPEPASDDPLEAPDLPRLEQPVETAHTVAEAEPAVLESTLESPATVDEETTRPGPLPPTPDSQASPTPAAPSPVAASNDSVQATVEPAISGLSSTQVAPPSDLQGPGWAFAGDGETNEATSESEHEEAQRLARLLVTEIKLYNEEAVEQGRQDGDVYSRLQDDIDRSRQIFEDRIDPAVRGENEYFKQALVRILAGGDPTLLGI